MPRPTTPALSRRGLLAGAALTSASLPAAGAATADAARPPLWRLAETRGLAFGSSIATWQLDAGHRRLHDREAAVLLTEDDLLWHRLKPRPGASLDFRRGDRLADLAGRHDQLLVGTHLVWDEGFGAGWSDADLWDLDRRRARRLLHGVIRREVEHYRGRMSAWIVANEVTAPQHADRHGLRTDVPWRATIGPDYVASCFHLVREVDPRPLRIINEYGFETDAGRRHRAAARRRAFLVAVDRLLAQGAPVQAVGIQGHLLAGDFARRFDERAYRAFLRELADRGLTVLVTELDVLDDGLPADVRVRDRAVADVYRRYLDVTLDERAVKAVIAFGLTDRYTWLEEDEPRRDGAHRRPLAFDRRLRPKPAYDAIGRALRHAPERERLWSPRRG